MAGHKDRQIAVAVIGGIFAIVVAVVTITLPRILDSGSGGSGGARTATIGPTATAPPTGTVVPTIPGETSIFLSKESAPGGATVLVGGRGYAAEESVVIRVHATQVATTRADGGGSFANVAITIPEKLSVFAPFQVDVVATGQSSIRSASAPITVSG